ncbi:hypothetical protein PhCBS80983_g03259 [Powellomyces hirtus]|uniref:Bax inhibitor 1 n=1 Tax=Powellomyces hirtus TaxID=109895 RepID=A0A507E4C5_9FUNG|nr:hypothetical protein PhCBS80983_g03259 [Powellomyces hirtus]
MSSAFLNQMSSFWSSPAATAAPWSNIKTTLPRDIHAHVQKVYANLATMLALSAVAAYADLVGIVNGGSWSLLACFACMMVFTFTPPTRSNERLRQYLLYGFSFTKGLSLGPLIAHTLYLNPAIVVKALLGTAMVFGCFTVSVLTSPRRDVIYLRGVMATATMTLAGLSLVNAFMGSAALFSVELYFGLLVFAGFVVYDTQLMIAKAEMGNRDYLGHSMEL